MPYTPSASAAQLQEALTDPAAPGQPTLTLIRGGAYEVPQAAGAEAGATAAAEAGGVAGIDGSVASTAAVPVVGELVLAGYAGYRLGMGLRAIPGWDQAMHHFGGGIASTLGFAPSVSFTVPDNVKFFVADRLQHYSIVNAQAQAGMYSQLQGQLLHLTHLSRALAATAVAINQGARLHDAQSVAQANHYTDIATLKNDAYTNQKNAATLKAAQQYADRAAATANKHATTAATVAQRNAEVHADNAVNALRKQLPAMITAGATAAIAAHLAPVTRALTAIEARLKPLEAEAEDCVKPMCEDIGPSTDWGKFFHAFKEAAFFAALAEFAGADVGDIEAAAVKVAELLGPVLETWLEAYVGILPGGSGRSPGVVTDTLGKLPGML